MMLESVWQRVFDGWVLFVTNLFWVGYALRLVYVWPRLWRASSGVAVGLAQRLPAGIAVLQAHTYRNPPDPALPRLPSRSVRWTLRGFHLLPPAWGPLWFPVLAFLLMGRDLLLPQVSELLAYGMWLGICPLAFLARYLCRRACAGVSGCSHDELAKRWRWAAVGCALVGVMVGICTFGLHGAPGLSAVFGPFASMAAIASVAAAISACRVANDVERAGALLADGADGTPPGATDGSTST